MTLDHLAHLEADAAAVVDVLRRADPDAAVPGCPDWALRDLALHLGRVHRWATGIVRTGERGPFDSAEVADGELADWLASGAADLLAALRQPERDCWTFPGPGRTGFWVRRMALETVVHRVDSQRADRQEGQRAGRQETQRAGRQEGHRAGRQDDQRAGLEDPVADELGEDGIAEVLEVMLPRQVALGRIQPPADGAALVTATTRLVGAAPPATTVTGPAGVVLLLLWRRVARTDPRLVVTGDVDALDRLLGLALTP